MSYPNATIAALACLVALAAFNGCSDDGKARSGSGGSVVAGGSGEGGEGGEDGGAGGVGPCVPRTCESSRVLCGALDDGCGAVVMCGECGNGGQGGDGSCMPTTCELENKNCGRIGDGCGHELDCGTCDGDTCGAVVPNVCGCPSEEEVFASTPRTAGRAESAGFSGSEQDYIELFEVTCETHDDCASACVDRGGTDDMCEASECLDDGDGGRVCLPAPAWGNLQGIQAESSSVTEAATLVVVATSYHDPLLTTAFDLDVPEGAMVRGITVELRRAGHASVSDDSLRIVKGGRISGAERAASDPWSEDLTWVTYGGPDDLWGEEWSSADVMADDFGVALAVNYESSVGNARAYVDQVRVTVHYSLRCE